MPRPQMQFLDRMVQVTFGGGGNITGVLESVGDDGSLLIRQGKRPVWIPLHQVRYVSPVDDRVPEDT